MTRLNLYEFLIDVLKERSLKEKKLIVYMTAVHGQACNAATLRRSAAFSTSGHSSSQQASTLQEMK